MALYMGRDTLTPLAMKSVDRWVVARMMGIERVFNSPQALLDQLESEDKLSKTDGPAYVEHLITFMASNILQYYSRSPEFTLTDYEIIAMIRMYEGRGINSSLRSMLPIVIRRVLNGAVQEIPASDKVQFFYDPDILVQKVEDYQLMFRYAKALLQLDGVDSCLKMLHTISEMPAKPCRELRTDTQTIAKVLIGMINDGDSEGKITPKYILRAIGANIVEAPSANIHISHQVQNAISAAISQLDPPDITANTLGLELLKKPLADLLPEEIEEIIQKLSNQPNQFAQLSWISKSFFKLNEKAQGRALKWVANSLTETRGRFIVFIGNYAKVSPMKCAQFVHILSRRLWERESDRRSILAKAFPALISSGNPMAVGTMLVTIAMGPNSPTMSENGPQSIGERAKALANAIERHKTALAPMAPQLMPHLLKAVESLKARRSERILLTELARQGMPLDVRMAKAAIWIRMSNQVDQEQFLELIEQVLQAFPISSADSSAEKPASVLLTGHSALYITILKGLGHCRLVKSFELLASELIQSRRLNTRTFGALASIWLDTIGYGWKSTSSDVTRVWIILKNLTSSNKQLGPNGTSYSLNVNHFHSVIEAYVRVGDISSAWDIIRNDMREYSIEPNIMTFYTLVSPLANKSTLWPIGKSVILKFKEFYPNVLKTAVEDKSNTLIFKALLRQALKDECPI
ncbi:hypothetical protein IWW36_001162 [Coemansia brasiliensis]|uniref:Uncharacterized protein n=1 Tax=Coemansia brasiliensis TaxID=2650707 RepID=A0A9W8IC53_9FUNG|nr:hypothetical protein IWW36_001162 [Coemansia brasiliensis]